MCPANKPIRQTEWSMHYKATLLNLANEFCSDNAGALLPLFDGGLLVLSHVHCFVHAQACINMLSVTVLILDQITLHLWS